MDILEFTELNPLTFKVKIRIEAESMLARFEEVLAEHVKYASIAGFRQGKVPRRIVERQVGLDKMWRMAVERAAQDAFVEALDVKRTNSISKPHFEHCEYRGEGDYEFSVVFHTEPPSPDEILRRAMKPDCHTVYPEDHFPKDFEYQAGMNPAQQIDPFDGLDHGHAISSGFPMTGSAGIVPDLEPDAPNAQDGLGDISGLPGSPEFYPKAVGNLTKFLKKPALTRRVPEDPQGEKPTVDPDKQKPERLKKPKE